MTMAKEYEDLPDPYSPQQRKAMTEQIDDAISLIAAKGGSKDDYIAEVMHIVGMWSARAGSLFASNINHDLREQMVAALTALNAEIVKLRGDVMELREQVTLLETRLSILELRRADAQAAA
jgi:hypothetical protein